MLWHVLRHVYWHVLRHVYRHVVRHVFRHGVLHLLILDELGKVRRSHSRAVIVPKALKQFVFPSKLCPSGVTSFPLVKIVCVTMGARAATTDDAPRSGHPGAKRYAGVLPGDPRGGGIGAYDFGGITTAPTDGSCISCLAQVRSEKETAARALLFTIPVMVVRGPCGGGPWWWSRGGGLVVVVPWWWSFVAVVPWWWSMVVARGGGPWWWFQVGSVWWWSRGGWCGPVVVVPWWSRGGGRVAVLLLRL